jgi:hypothetical protein
LDPIAQRFVGVRIHCVARFREATLPSLEQAEASAPLDELEDGAASTRE